MQDSTQRKPLIERIKEKCDRVREYFFSNKTGAAVLWALVIIVCVAILCWFFFVSPFGAPSEPIYQGF